MKSQQLDLTLTVFVVVFLLLLLLLVVMAVLVLVLVVLVLVVVAMVRDGGGAAAAASVGGLVAVTVRLMGTNYGTQKTAALCSDITMSDAKLKSLSVGCVGGLTALADCPVCVCVCQSGKQIT